MNKKTKNIVSVLQSMSAAVLCTLCSVLFLASCTDENLVDNPHAQNALRTLSVDLGMPHAKPAYADGTASRAALDAQTAEILLGDSTLAVSRAEGGTSYYTTSDWADNDQLLVRIDAGSTQARLTLKYIVPTGETTGTWYLAKANSYVKYTGTAFSAYNAQDVTPLFAEVDGEDTEKMPISGPLTMHIDYTSTATQVEVSIIYAPDMEWSLADDTKAVSMKQKANATTQTTAPELWTVAGNAWTTNQARLRVNTGTGNAGDVVTLTSSAFDSAWEVEPTTFTATTDGSGDAYFYGATVDAEGNPSALTDNFLVKLTQMRVAVPQQGGAPPASEGRSVTLDEATQTVIITLDTPITLLEASDVVPVTLTAEKAYKLMASDKRTASVQANLSVIDGSCTDLDFITKQIEAALSEGVTEFTVINDLAVYAGGNEGEIHAGTVVGEAIMNLVSFTIDSDIPVFPSKEQNPYVGSISLVLRDATTVPNMAFPACGALKSVTFNQNTSVGDNAFAYSTFLETVSWEKVKSIGEQAFFYCPSLTSVVSDAVLEVGDRAFYGCLDLAEVNLPNTNSIGGSSFYACQSLATVCLPKVASLDGGVFQYCIALTSLTLGKVTDGNAYSDTFHNANTEGCDLILGEGQQETSFPVTASNGKLMWAGKPWKSITVGEIVYTAEGDNLCGTNNGVTTTVIDGVTYGVIDGQCGITEADSEGHYIGTADDVTTIKAQIDAAMDMEIDHFLVVNQLATYTKEGATEFDIYGGTVVGEAILQLTLDTNRNPNLSSDNKGKISVTLADATEVPEKAFICCFALSSVTAEKVEVIGGWAFYACKSLTDIALPKANSIGESALYGNEALTSLTLPMVTKIGGNALATCNQLKNITFGSVIEEMGDGVFTYVDGCALTLHAGQLNKTGNLTVSVSYDRTHMQWGSGGAAWKSITLSDGTKYYIDENNMPTVEVDGTCGITGNNPTGDDSHISAMTNKIKVVGNAAAKVIVKKGLASYGGMPKTVVGAALSRSIVHLVLDDAITFIPEEAFSNCGPLVSVTTSATNIGDIAFNLCSSLKEVTLRATSATNIGVSAFNGCSSLEEVTLRAASATTIERLAFSQCHNLATVNLSANTAIGEQAFSGCTALTDISWDKVTSIGGSRAFSGCTLTGPITINEGVTVSADAFQEANVSGCDLVLPASQVTGITITNNQLMWAGAAWKSITLSDDTKYYIDKNNNNMPTVEVDGTCGITGDNPTGDGSHISAMTNKIKVVGNAATSQKPAKVIVNTGLAKCEASSKGTETVVGVAIGTYADGSITLVLNETITSVPSNAFYWCKSLTSVSLPKATTIGDYAFERCMSLTSVSLPAATWIGTQAFKICSALTSLTFGSVVQQVGSSVFSNSNTENCALFLAEGQQGVENLKASWIMPGDVMQLQWATYTWKSITIGGEPFPSEGPM